MQMLKKIFNSNNKYYLELDELKDSEVVQTALKTAEKATEVVKEKAVEIAKSEPVQEVVKTTGGAVETAQNKLESAIAENKPTQAKSTKASKATIAKGKASNNSKVAKSQAVKKEVKAAPQNGASSFDPPFWVAAMNNTNSTNSNSNGQMAEATFAASDQLMPTTTKYRRRPGGSLAKFRDMAKAAKTPRK
jgi:uncharacterized beta-barrel protein YwiB (DUF1934 family)